MIKNPKKNQFFEQWPVWSMGTMVSGHGYVCGKGGGGGYEVAIQVFPFWR